MKVKWLSLAAFQLLLLTKISSQSFDTIAVHPRFQGSTSINSIIQGKNDTLFKINDPISIKKIQNTLNDLGYPLPKSRVSGKWDDETKNALQIFKQDHQISGIDDRDLILLLNDISPEINQKLNYTFRFNELIADKNLNITIAVGFEEDLLYLQLIQSLKGWLSANQFSPQLIDGAKETYYAKKIIASSIEPIDVFITFISPIKGAAEFFKQSLINDEIILYLGHARGGLGPDFDHKNNSSEQIVFGKGSKKHSLPNSNIKLPGDSYYKTVVAKPINDLEKMENEWDNKYRIWFFNACNTNYYLDEFRNGLLPEFLNREKLDYFGSDNLTPIEGYYDTGLIFLEGIFKGASINEIVTNLNESNVVTINKLKKLYPDKAKVFETRKKPYFAEGITDNQKID